jgi:NADH dehydrogenase FAD-containing subunit
MCSISEVTQIDRAAKSLTVREISPNGVSKEYQHPYDSLVLSLGAMPFKPPISGNNLSCHVAHAPSPTDPPQA